MDREKKPVVISGTGTNHCPVSIIRAESTELVQLFARARILHEALGIPLSGSGFFDLPSRLVDALVLLQEHKSRVDLLIG